MLNVSICLSLIFELLGGRYFAFRYPKIEAFVVRIVTLTVFLFFYFVLHISLHLFCSARYGFHLR